MALDKPEREEKQMQERFCLQMVACNGGCGSGSVPETNDGIPVGTIISYMGTKAPQHYLVCDGAELYIEDYPQLAKQMIEEFGRVDYFGGNGTTTLAVPDLRNEFLRGYCGKAAEQLSGEIGRHQAGTDHILFDKRPQSNENGVIQIGTVKDQVLPVNIEQMTYLTTDHDGIYVSQFTPTVSQVSSQNNPVGCFYRARPTNMSVLFCIKYE